MKENFHTHTWRCQHADGADEDYVRAAIQGGFSRLGFADHAAWPYRSDFISGMRMPMSQLPEYIQSINDLKRRYAGQIDVKLGFEAEFYPRYIDHLHRLREELGFDFLIMGQHYLESDEDHPYVPNMPRTDDSLMQYADAVAEGLQTGLFAYVAHPDLFMRTRTEFTTGCEKAAEIICQAARENDMPIEYNLLGLQAKLAGSSRGYPCQPFWQIAARLGVRGILGMDAHNPKDLLEDDLWQQGLKDLTDLGMTVQHSIFTDA